MRRTVRLLYLCLTAALLAASPATAVIIKSGTGTGNTTAPTPASEDPGWANVGQRTGGLTVTYLGNGWVLTAHHVGAGNVKFEGIDYTLVPGSAHQLVNPDTTGADMMVFRISGETGLPSLPLRATTPPVDANLTVVGNGRNRGTAINWSGISGWNWGTGYTMRWGTNRVSEVGLDILVAGRKTHSFSTDFTSSGGTTHEEQGAEGDSGGAAFLKNGTTWELAGVLHSIAGLIINEVPQPASTALYGNVTNLGDVSYYRSQILGYVNQPACNDGLDDDLDGKIDFPADDGCTSAIDVSERHACEDQLDNDGDGLFDYPLDPGCAQTTSDIENPQCNDGLDNDGDTKIDLGDPQCFYAFVNAEAKTCGLGPELAVLLPVLAALRARRSRAGTPR